MMLRRCLLPALLLLVAAPLAAEEPPSLPQLEVVERYALPSNAVGAVDVRWAGEDSVFIAFDQHGVVQYELSEGLPFVREWIPDVETLEIPMKRFSSLGVSSEWMVVGSYAWRLVWRKVESGGGGFHLRNVYSAGQFHDVDLQNDRLVMVGFPSVEVYRKSEGGIVWTGEVNTLEVEDWRPIVENEDLAEDFEVIDRRGPNRGSVRFLDNGDLVVYTGLDPEVLQLSSTGTVERRWSARELWGTPLGEDEHPEGLEMEPVDRAELAKAAVVEERLRNDLLIDEVLAFPDDPAVIVRRPAEGSGERQWLLGLLGPEIRWYRIPDLDVSDYARLRGDVDHKGRILLLTVSRGRGGKYRLSGGDLLVLELPPG